MKAEKNNIKALRKKSGLTQTQLAERTNISRSYLADVESFRYNPSLDVLKKIASALNVTLSEVVGEDSEEQKNSPSNEREFLEDVQLELTDAELMKKFNFTIDGKELSPKEAKALIAFVRMNRDLD